MSYSTKHFFSSPYCLIVFGSFLEKYTLHEQKHNKYFFSAIFTFILHSICCLFDYFISYFNIFLSKSPLMQNKSAATADSPPRQRQPGYGFSLHWKAFHYITSSNAEIGAQWIILPFTSVKHSKGYLSSFNF